MSHSLVPGDMIAYEVDLRRSLSLASEGTSESPIGTPASADITITSDLVVVFEVREGPRPGTFLLVPQGETDPTPTVEGTVDGEPVDQEGSVEILGWVGAVAEEVVVEGTGVVHPVSASTLELIPSPLTGTGPGFLGPVLPEEEVQEGEEWTASVSEGKPDGVRPEWSVTARTEADGDQLEIVGESATDGGEVDVSAFYQDFLGSFGDGDEADLILRMEPTVTGWMTRFDPVEGRVVESEVDALIRMVLTGAAPDRVTGEVGTFELSIEVDDDVDVRSVPVPDS